jgi:iron complex outermembrane recepter protein
MNRSTTDRMPSRHAGSHLRCLRRKAVLTVLMLLVAAVPAIAQSSATLVGTVTNRTGEPVGSASVRVDGTERGTLTDGAGRFVITGLATGEATLTVQRLGYRTASTRVLLSSSGATRTDVVLDEAALEMAGLVVSATREMRLKSQTPASVGVVSGQELRDARPSHPGEVAGRVPGVWVSATSGEGHMTAIRQPRTTKPMFLFLEDGVPTRSTGFFNHNALYEINVPQADRMEILKGPATALYGSDAIGGVINVETRRASLSPQLEGSLEGGSNGWTRGLFSASGTRGDDGVRADLNLTASDGYRDRTAYDRQAGTLRWDRYLAGGSSLTTVATFSRVRQTDASSLSEEDFASRPALNHNPIAFRDVDAFRISTAFQRSGERSRLNITPFFRHNRMELVPSWMLTYDPVVYETGHRSYGVLARLHHDLGVWDGQLIGGIDAEYSPGGRTEHRIATSRRDGIFTEYTVGDLIYDYDVAFRGASPYVQMELAPARKLRVSAGLRYDRVGYDYRNQLDAVDTGMHRRPASTEIRYDHLSPKLGFTFEVAPALGLFGSYRHGFRAPSEGQLFRQGSSQTGIGLQPVRADNYEIGIRGEGGGRVSYEASVYRMDVTNDILTLATRVDGVETRVNSNAGATRHEGVEMGAGVVLPAGFRIDASYSNALHSYREWTPSATQDFSGNRMESAPRELINARVSYAPAGWTGVRVGLEWVRVGRYFTDPQNTHEYAGHNLVNARVGLPVTSGLELVGTATNLLDERYAEGASFNPFRGAEYSPGRPRAVHLGVQYRWQP